MKKNAPIHADHRVQRDYPAKVKFCPLCGGAMESRMLMPENAERKVCTRCGFVLFPGPKLVGGYVDFGENAADAALRETREEVGMRVAIGPLLGVFNDSAITVVVYLATPGNESPSLSDEASEVRYFAPDDIPWPDLAFPTTTDAVTAWVALERAK
jgi:ribosomal protein S27AE